VCLVLQLRGVVESRTPSLRAVEAIGILLPLAVFVFAGAYVMMSAETPSAFSEPISQIDGIYLSVTVLATVGFGDISPVADGARIAVTVQMLTDLVLVAVVVQGISGAISRSRQRPVDPAAEPR
jgi:hypothetical protein